MRRAFVAANWKLNGSIEANKALLDTLMQGLSSEPSCDVVIAAPYVYLPQCKALIEQNKFLKLAAQNVSEYENGAYTGEVSAAMLADLACEYAIVGHSERRQLFGESDQQLVQKFAQLQKQGVAPILCIGETLEERERDQTESVVRSQLKAIIDSLGVKALSKSVLAYEPIWAIGTGKTASPEQAQEVHSALRAFIASFDESVAGNLRIIYGGSVNENNAEDLFQQEDIDGGLIGGASLKAESFLQICKVN